MRYPELERHAKLFGEYTELRVQENRISRIQILAGNVTNNETLAQGGVSARAFKNGVWGFASQPGSDDLSIARAVKLATENVRFLAGREKRGEAKLPARPGSGVHDLSTARTRVGQKGYMEFAKAIDARIAEKYPKLRSRFVAFSCLDMEKTVYVSDGGSSHSMTPRTFVYVDMTAESGADTVELGDIFGGRGQFEDVFSDPADLYAGIDAIYEQLMKKAEGVYPEAGLRDVVLGSDLAGILAHEAIGHTVEADLVLGGSVAADYLGKPVASELVTLVDYAHTALGKPCPIPVHVDDEGTEARDAVLIEKGILKGYLHNKETAGHFGHEPTGNARAYQFSDEPLVRMRNTAIVPGTSRLEDLIAGVDDGYYLLRPSNGQADSTSEFMFGVTLGYEIKKGKLGRGLRDTTISGVAFDMLKTVTALSDDMTWSCGGMCGKKQMIPVGMGGPAIRCKITIGGR